MNSHQRRKLRRKRHKPIDSEAPHFHIHDWADLAKVPESKTHWLEIEVDECNGWIKRKDSPLYLGHYLSTHTFYGANYKNSTQLLRKCGFNVTLANWDAETSKS